VNEGRTDVDRSSANAYKIIGRGPDVHPPFREHLAVNQPIIKTERIYILSVQEKIAY
jgi:hypothetical protein